MTGSKGLHARTSGAGRLGRSGMLGAGAGLGLALLSGCSALPSLPGVGGGGSSSGGTSIIDLFSKIDPAIWAVETGSISWDENPLFHPLTLHFSRPRAIGELFGVADDLEPTMHNRALPREELPRTTQPELFTTPHLAGLQTFESALTSSHFRYASEVAVLASHSFAQPHCGAASTRGCSSRSRSCWAIPDHQGRPQYTRRGEQLIPADGLAQEGQTQPFIVEITEATCRSTRKPRLPSSAGTTPLSTSSSTFRS